MRTALSGVGAVSSRKPLAEPIPLEGLAVFVVAGARDGVGISHHNSPAAAKPSSPNKVALARQLMTVSSRPTRAGDGFCRCLRRNCTETAPA